MKHPPYQLRPNKSIDRLLFVELLSRFDQIHSLTNYTYVGFGGPFLVDIRLLSQTFPDLRYISIERDRDTYKRQIFHKNTRNLSIVCNDLNSYLTQEFKGRNPCIFWLDYTDLKPQRIDEFGQLLSMVALNSVIKVTLRAKLDDTSQTNRVQILDKLRQLYAEYLPDDLTEMHIQGSSFASLIQSMLRISAQKSLPSHAGTTFQLLHSCRYADGPQMLSITGVVCSATERTTIKKIYKDWEHRNLSWKEPIHIDVPDLSVKERLKLERHLPSEGTGSGLSRILGYRVDVDTIASNRKLKQYQDFHRHYPLFSRILV